MSRIYVARSVKLSKWGGDVGVGKELFKVGCAEEPLDSLIASGWAGETDWKLLGADDVGEMSEEDAVAAIARREKMIDPNLYPKLKGAVGVFRIKPTSVENHILIARALDGAAHLEIKLKPKDFADYLIQIVTRRQGAQ